MRQKLLIVFLLCLVLGMLVVIPGCSDSDTPQYGEGEAIALVKRNLAALNEKSYIKADPKWVLPKNAQNLELNVATDTKAMLDGIWESSYLNNGKWLVTCAYSLPVSNTEYTQAVTIWEQLSSEDRSYVIRCLTYEAYNRLRLHLGLEALNLSYTLTPALRYKELVDTLNTENDKIMVDSESEWHVYEATGTIEELP